MSAGPFEWVSARPALEFTLVAIGLILDGFLGAWISTHIRAQTFPVWAAFLSGNLSLLMWTYLARYSKMSLPVASVFFDLAYNAAWIFALVYLGQRMTQWQIIGMAIAVIGVAIMGYRTPVP
jgi:drug/metabolite transporter (DMT)-like permease